MGPNQAVTVGPDQPVTARQPADEAFADPMPLQPWLPATGNGVSSWHAIATVEEVVDEVKGHVLAIGNPWIVVERVRKGEQKPMMGMLNLGEAEAVGVAVRILRRV